MKKLLLMKTVLLLFALVVGSGSVWADDPDVTYNFSLFTSAATVTLKADNNNLTITLAKNNGSNNPAWSSSQARIYAKGSLTVSSASGNISKIVYTYVVNENKNGVSPTIDGVEGSTNAGTWNSSTKTWEGNDNAVTFSTSGSAGNVGFTKLEITYANSYTITTTVNESSMGSVSLSGTTITATPNPGYRVQSGDYGYTITSGNATVTHAGHSNTLTVSPTSDCTVRVNFEAIPSHTLSYNVSPAAAGDVTLGATTLLETATTSATAAAAAGYKFTGWSISGTDASLSSTTDNPVTVTMGTTDATITANFVAIPTNAITYSVNGNERTVNVEENAAVDLSAPASGIPAGYVFRGWVVAANKIDTPTDTDPKANYVTSATSTEDITYYAVMAAQNGVIPTTVTLNASGMSTASYKKGTRNDDEGNSWSYYASVNNDSGTMNFGLNKNANNYNIGSPSFSGNVTAISMKVKNGSSTDARTVYICSSNTTAQPTSGDIASLSVPKSSTFDTSRSIDLSSSPTFSQFYVYVSAALSFSEIKVTYNKTSYSNFCTTVPTTTVSVGASKYASFCSSDALNFTDCEVKAYKAKVNNGQVVLTQVDEVPANEGVILYGEEGDYNVTVIASAPAITENELIGVTSRTLVEWTTGGDGKYNYILQGGVFKKAAAGGHLKANRAYLHTSYDVTAAGARDYLEFAFEDGDVTAIETVKGEKADGQYYNLNGQKVQNPTKGLYIINGKKVVIK